MTAQRDFDRLLSAWLDADAPERAPTGLADAAISGVARTERRPAWRIPERWLSVQATARLTYFRPAFTAAIVVFLMILAVIAIAITGAPRHRLGANGLIAFDSNGQIIVANPDGSNRQQLTLALGGARRANWTQASNPVFAPDGRRIAFWYRDPASLTSSLVVIDVDGRHEQLLATGIGMQGGVVSWSADSRHLAYADEQEQLDTTSGDVLGGDAHGYVISLEGTRTPIGEPNALVLDPTFSPDGAAIAYRSGSGATLGVYVTDADGTHPRRVTSAPGSGFAFWHPAWSPDSKAIAFVAGDNRQHDIFVVGADGKDERRITQASGQYWWPAWSPDGSRVAYVDEGASQLVILELGGDAQRAVGSGVRNFPFTWSPDGTMLYALSQDTGKLLVIDLSENGKQLELQAEGNQDDVGSWQRVDR